MRERLRARHPEERGDEQGSGRREEPRLRSSEAKNLREAVSGPPFDREESIASRRSFAPQTPHGNDGEKAHLINILLLRCDTRQRLDRSDDVVMQPACLAARRSNWMGLHGERGARKTNKGRLVALCDF
jgi:hypothetical protein